jgi:hypothetical protein
MTDFEALLIADDGGPATPLVLVKAADFDGWLLTQGERTRAFVAAQGFAAAPDTLALVPGDAPGRALPAAAGGWRRRRRNCRPGATGSKGRLAIRALAGCSPSIGSRGIARPRATRVRACC